MMLRVEHNSSLVGLAAAVIISSFGYFILKNSNEVLFIQEKPLRNIQLRRNAHCQLDKGGQ